MRLTLLRTTRRSGALEEVLALNRGLGGGYRAGPRSLERRARRDRHEAKDPLDRRRRRSPHSYYYWGNPRDEDAVDWYHFQEVVVA